MDLTVDCLQTELIEVSDTSQVGHARRAAQHLAQRAGFSEESSGRAALVATELATNIVKHATHGALYLRNVAHADGYGVEMIAVDKGPGFDLHQCLPDGISSRGTSGIGLGAVVRQSQVFDAYTSETGAVVMARLYHTPCKDQRIGAVHLPIEAGYPCGDTWRVVREHGRVTALVIDGLGHGPDAAKASHLGREALDLHPFIDLSTLMTQLNAAMAGSRGGAVAIAQHDPSSQTLRYAGIGNISAFLVNAAHSRGLASLPGIVGVQFRKVQTFDIKDVRDDLLIMHSDGIQTRWNLRAYPGLTQRHPAIIAAVLHRDFCRGRDDVTVLVIALGDMA